MKIHTLWHDEQDGDMPWLVSSYDEYSADNCGDIPDFYKEELKKHPGKRRELIIEIKEGYVRELFKAPTCKGEVG